MKGPKSSLANIMVIDSSYSYGLLDLKMMLVIILGRIYQHKPNFHVIFTVSNWLSIIAVVVILPCAIPKRCGHMVVSCWLGVWACLLVEVF